MIEACHCADHNSTISQGAIHTCIKQHLQYPKSRVKSYFKRHSGRVYIGHERNSRTRCKVSGKPWLPENRKAYDDLDSNQLQTALNNAVQSEDYEAAAQISKRLKACQGHEDGSIWDWRVFGCPPWLAERAEQMGFKLPTGKSKHLCCSSSDQR